METVLWCVGGFLLLVVISAIITALFGESEVDVFIVVFLMLAIGLLVCITATAIFTSEPDESAKDNSGETTQYIPMPIPYYSPYVSQVP